MTDLQWNLIRKFTYWILLDLDGRIKLPMCQRLPQTIDELYYYATGLNFEFQLDETLQITSQTLKDTAEALAKIHRVAAAIIVNSPSDADVKELREDLKKISDDLKNEQRFKAGIAFAGAIANIIGQIQNG